MQEVRTFIVYVDHCLTPYVFRFTLTKSRNNVCLSAFHSRVLSYCLEHGQIDSETSVDTGVPVLSTQTRVFTEPSMNGNRSLPNDSIYIEVVLPVLEMLICRCSSCLLEQNSCDSLCHKSCIFVTASIILEKSRPWLPCSYFPQQWYKFESDRRLMLLADQHFFVCSCNIRQGF